MTALRGWCTSPSATANPPFQSRQAQLESGVRGNVPAPFGAGERLQSPTYRYTGGKGQQWTSPAVYPAPNGPTTVALGRRLWRVCGISRQRSSSISACSMATEPTPWPKKGGWDWVLGVQTPEG